MGTLPINEIIVQQTIAEIIVQQTIAEIYIWNLLVIHFKKT